MAQRIPAELSAMMSEDDRAWLNSVGASHPPGRFGHFEHLRLAWLALSDCDDVTAAQADVSTTVRHLAEAHGVPQRYNQTVTDGWVRIVAHCRQVSRAESLESLLNAFPWLLDKRLLMRHYRSRTLASLQARRTWVEPDLRPIPGALRR